MQRNVVTVANMDHLSICSACLVFCFDDLVDSQAQSLLTFSMSGWCGSAIPVLTAALTVVWVSNTCTVLTLVWVSKTCTAQLL